MTFPKTKVALAGEYLQAGPLRNQALAMCKHQVWLSSSIVVQAALNICTRSSFECIAQLLKTSLCAPISLATAASFASITRTPTESKRRLESSLNIECCHFPPNWPSEQSLYIVVPILFVSLGGTIFLKSRVVKRVFNCVVSRGLFSFL